MKRTTGVGGMRVLPFRLAFLPVHPARNIRLFR
jgi:hypothetical protein